MPTFVLVGFLLVSYCRFACYIISYVLKGSKRDLHDLPRNDGYDIAKAFGLTCRFLVNTQLSTAHSSDPPGQTQPVHLCLPYQIYLGMVRRWQALGGSWLLLLYGFQAFGFLMSKQGRYYTSDF